MSDANWRPQTRLVHGGDDENPTDAISSPIFQSATWAFDDPEASAAAMAAMAHPQFYGRYGTPNTAQVESTMAELEGGEAALASASGMGAISLTLLGLLAAGDHVVAQEAVYPTTARLFNQFLPRFGVTCTQVAQEDVGAFAAAIRPETRLLYVETPANPTLSLTDLAGVAALAREHSLLTVADNTFATPYNQRPIALGIDVVVHSATKYLAGHHDVVAGVVVASREIVDRLWRQHIMLGSVLHPFEAWLLLRGLKTFRLRLAQHNATAQAVAAFLESQPSVRSVYYPGLPSHPQHALARRQMSGFGGMISFDLSGGQQAGYRLLGRLRLIRQAVSLGGVHSLLTHPASTISAVQGEDAVRASGVVPGLVRLSIGLEDPDDLLEDLAQALEGL